MAEREPGDQLRRAAEALAAARAAARARGARPAAPRRRPGPAPTIAGAAGSGAEPTAEVASPAGSSQARPAGMQGNSPDRERVISEEIEPDEEPSPSAPASGRRARSGQVTGRSGVRPGFAPVAQRKDPVRLSSAIGGLLDAEGWALSVATGSVFGRWAQIVGADLAEHTTPERLADGELTIAADSTAWATQVRLLAAQLVLRLNQELGDGTVLRVKVHGPAQPGRKPGQWRVRGGRGPRDTYG